MIVDQHAPFDTDLVEVTEHLPKWLPAVDIDPDWHMGSGEFPTVQDEALIEKEEPDVR